VTRSEAVLSPEEVVTLRNLLGVFLPSTSGPGANEAETVTYVIGRLRGRDRQWRGVVRDSLQSAGGDEAGYVARLAEANDDESRVLFARLRSWAWEGFLCDPTYGGNRGNVGWRRFGAPEHPKARGYTPQER
jgi:hypothetical protein